MGNYWGNNKHFGDGKLPQEAPAAGLYSVLCVIGILWQTSSAKSLGQPPRTFPPNSTQILVSLRVQLPHANDFLFHLLIYSPLHGHEWKCTIFPALSTDYSM